MPDLPPELKADVEALKKPIRKYTLHCFTLPMDRSDSRVPEDCEGLQTNLRKTLAAAKPEAVTHAIFRHGVLELVRAASAGTTPPERVWQGGEDDNAKLLAEFVAMGDAHTVAQYAIHAMRLAQKDDGDGDEIYSSASSRVQWLAWLTARATQAPYPPIKGVWDEENLPAGKVARRWREWWATKQAKSSEQLRRDGLAETLAALADPEPAVRYWAARSALQAKVDAAHVAAVWTVRDALLDASLGKPAAEAFGDLAQSVRKGELLLPAPLAGKTPQVLNPPPPLVQDPNDPLEQVSPAVPLPRVPAEHKDKVAQLVPLYRQLASLCWADSASEYGDTWNDECYKAMSAINDANPEVPQVVRWHAAVRGLFAPLGEGKLKLPKKPKANGPVYGSLFTLEVTPEVAALVDQIVAHVASLALARPSWRPGEEQLLFELTTAASKEAMDAAGAPLPWEPARPDAMRASLQRQVTAWNLRAALAKDHKGKPWARLSQQLARSGNLASRYRFACESYWVDTKAERAEAVRLVRQVLLDTSIAPKIRAAFEGGRCSGLKPRELLVGTPWPSPAAVQSLVAAPEAPEAPAPLSCRTALQGWYAKEAVKACGSGVGDDGEPRADGLWAQLDAGEDPTRVQALVETWLPRLQGAALAGLREVWAAAATAAGQRQQVAERLTAWLGGSTDGALADRLALLQGKPASPRWWLTAATGAQCTARHGQPVGEPWLARRGWIASLPAFTKEIASLKLPLRKQVAQRVASACPVPQSRMD
ncbi:MAG: hypothetical protein HY902_09960 [Deltaproteobacteria bacterium]|nr:hypothetical protein [Deltaproteobacteria bacterium]